MEAAISTRRIAVACELITYIFLLTRTFKVFFDELQVLSLRDESPSTGMNHSECDSA